MEGIISVSVMSSAHSPSFQSLHLRHSSFWFSKLSVTSPTSQLIFQPFPCFTYVTTHSPTLPLLHLRHSSFSNPSFASPTSQDFHLHHLVSCLCNLSVTSPMPQLILQPFFHLSYITGFSLTSPGEPPMVSVRFLLCWYKTPHLQLLLRSVCCEQKCWKRWGVQLLFAILNIY